MNKAFEKILERLDAKKQYFQKFYEADGKTEEDECINKVTQLAFDDAKNIVQEVAEEYNNGWIPCSERLPVGKEWEIIDEDGDTLYKHVLCQTYDSGVPIVVGFYQTDNWFTADTYDTIEVIAWQPLPPSFEPKNHSGEFNGMVEED